LEEEVWTAPDLFGYILAGYTRQYEADYENAWLIKTDANGNELWNESYGGKDSSEEAYSVVQTSDGGYILAGHKGYFFGAEKSDAWLIKTDMNGNMQWNKTFGEINHLRANAVKRYRLIQMRVTHGS
jgi:hypothetical protein